MEYFDTTPKKNKEKNIQKAQEWNRQGRPKILWKYL